VFDALASYGSVSLNDLLVMYRVTRIIVNDFESKKLYGVHFMNIQNLHGLIGIVEKHIIQQL